MDTLNVVDATQSQVVDGQENAVDAAQTEVVGGQENPVNAGQEEVVEPQKQKPTIEESKAIAEQRKAREFAEKQAREAAEKLQKTEQLLKSFGFEGQTVDDLLVQGFAHAKGMTAEQYRAEEAARQAEMEALISSDPRVQKALEIEAQQTAQLIYQQDLLAIKTVNPTEAAMRIEDLPNFEKFAEKRAKGYDAVDAYKLCCMTDKKPKSKGEDKAHMIPAGGNPSSTADIPSDVLSMYKSLMPKGKMEDFIKHYNKSRKEQ